MSLNAVQTYVKSLIDGLQLPFAQEGTLTVHISPPNPGDDQTTPVAYVWGAIGHERRTAGPRASHGQLNTGGIKHSQWQAEVWLYYAEQADDPDADSLFPAVIDAVCAIFRNTPMPTPITDPTTQAQSTVLAIGEDISIDYAPVRALAEQGYIQYEARIMLTLIESFQS
jgi:hypothetical protein